MEGVYSIITYALLGLMYTIHYYYSHIFPDSRAQYIYYVTLLAGRCGNNLWYSVIFRMGPSLFSMLVFVVRVIGLLCFLHFTSPLVLFCARPCLFLGGPTCIGWKYFATVLACDLCCRRLVLLLVTWGCLLCQRFFCCFIYLLHYPSIVCDCTQIQKEARSSRDFLCLLYVYRVFL